MIHTSWLINARYAPTRTLSTAAPKESATDSAEANTTTAAQTDAPVVKPLPLRRKMAA